MSRQINPYDMPEESSLYEEVPQDVPTPWPDRKADDLLYDKTERFYALIKKAKMLIETRVAPNLDSTQLFTHFVRLEYHLRSEEYLSLQFSDFECYLTSYLSDKRYNNNGKVDVNEMVKSLEKKLKAIVVLNEISC